MNTTKTTEPTWSEIIEPLESSLIDEILSQGMSQDCVSSTYVGDIKIIEIDKARGHSIDFIVTCPNYECEGCDDDEGDHDASAIFAGIRAYILLDEHEGDGSAYASIYSVDAHNDEGLIAEVDSDESSEVLAQQIARRFGEFADFDDLFNACRYASRELLA